MKKIIFSISFFITLILITNISNATTISVTPAEPVVGDEITVTVTVPNVHTASVTANVSGVISGKIKVVGGDLSGEPKDYSKSAKFTCSQEGNVNIEISSDSSAVLNGQYVDVLTSKMVTIKAKTPVVEPPQDTTTPTPETPTTPVEPEKPVEQPKSKEARLKNFGIKPKEYDFTGFKRDKLEYSVEVPNSVTSVEVYADPVDDKAKVSGAGTVTLNEGNNKIGVKVTAEDGETTKTYILTIKRKTAAEEETENGENRLKSLSIKPEKYDFSGFESEKTEYSIEVPNEVEEIEIAAKAMDSKAQVTGTGIITLEEGVNELKIEVIAVNGDKKIYTLTVTRKEAEAKEVLGLSTLTIEGLKLTPSFKTGTYEYTATLEEDLTSLEIKAKSNIEDATVEIIGNENLQQGENVITILVTNKENDEVATYQIIVNKNVAPVEQVVQTSWLKPSTWGKEEKIKIAIIIVLIILIIWAIILKIKISKESKNDRKVDFPGAEELDKAIAEHQELSEEPMPKEDVEEINSEPINVESKESNDIEQNYIEEIAQKKFGRIEDETVEKPKRRGRHF